MVVSEQWLKITHQIEVQLVTNLSFLTYDGFTNGMMERMYRLGLFASVFVRLVYSLQKTMPESRIIVTFVPLCQKALSTRGGFAF